MSVRAILETPGLLVDPAFIDEKELLKFYLNKAIETIVMQNQNRTERYFVIFHERFDGVDSRMKISVSTEFPGRITNTIVFWVCNRRGICEWLWTVPPKDQNGHQPPVEYNLTGVAYLQAKGAMPK